MRFRYRLAPPPLVQLRASEWIIRGARFSPEQVSSVELRVRAPRLGWALLSLATGAAALPALGAFVSSRGPLPAAIVGLLVASALVFYGCYQVVAGVERYEVLVRAGDALHLALATTELAEAREAQGRLDRARRSAHLRVVPAPGPEA